MPSQTGLPVNESSASHVLDHWFTIVPVHVCIEERVHLAVYGHSSTRVQYRYGYSIGPLARWLTTLTVSSWMALNRRSSSLLLLLLPQLFCSPPVHVYYLSTYSGYCNSRYWYHRNACTGTMPYFVFAIHVDSSTRVRIHVYYTRTGTHTCNKNIPGRPCYYCNTGTRVHVYSYVPYYFAKTFSNVHPSFWLCKCIVQYL